MPAICRFVLHFWMNSNKILIWQGITCCAQVGGTPKMVWGVPSGHPAYFAEHPTKAGLAIFIKLLLCHCKKHILEICHNSKFVCFV
jgi:hypothetical protein